MLEKVDDFLQLFERVIDARHVFEGDGSFGFLGQLGAALAEIEHAALGATGGPPTAHQREHTANENQREGQVKNSVECIIGATGPLHRSLAQRTDGVDAVVANGLDSRFSRRTHDTAEMI